ncbi:hypothetical protein GCM10010168_86060 [Actinoplanes ianthinogenes]|uniref:Uncharacterized protein n=1 Tax=Actinoplanes ianthinogenes TaxID=122358 RepID=A0ABN6CK31_9ACTN|nr:hypothetical protein [Actinoplanes ianthinogenes]BCJ45337.1 hypothetical protein Aiant_59940 [Actinoplanes ianthinogenes]GGR53866.1 hypothetical protein GCM10010168_86060 [Actinoplanes ianthinogenes]
MTWFKVDDNLHSHNKIRKILADDPAALALWTVAGSWSSDNLTDGLIPDHQLPWLIPSRADELARMLVTAGLWKRVKGGYQFHQWTADGDGTKRNPTREEVEAERRKKAEAGRKGGRASGKARSKPEARASASGSAGASGLLEPPTRPDPKGRVGGSSESLGGQTATRAKSDPPSPRCEQHQFVDDPPPCGGCADARRARTRWDLADAERRRTAPKCWRHRGQPADNCGLCRSEQLAEEDA